MKEIQKKNPTKVVFGRIISATGSREIPFMSYAGYWVKTADNQCGIIKNEIIYGPYEVKNCGQNCELCLETHILLCQYFT